MRTQPPERKTGSMLLLIVFSISAVFCFNSCSNNALGPEDPESVVRLDPTHEYFSQFIESEAGGTIELDSMMRFVVPPVSLESDCEIYGWVHTDVHVVEFEFYPLGTTFDPCASLELHWVVIRDLVLGNTDTEGLTTKVKPGKWKSEAPWWRKVRVNFRGENVDDIDPESIRLNGELEPVWTGLWDYWDTFHASFDYEDAFDSLEDPQPGKFSTITITGNYYNGDSFMVTRGVMIIEDHEWEGSNGSDTYDPEDVILSYFDENTESWVGIDAFNYESFGPGDWLTIDVAHFSRYAVTTHNTNSGGPE